MNTSHRRRAPKAHHYTVLTIALRHPLMFLHLKKGH